MLLPAELQFSSAAAVLHIGGKLVVMRLDDLN
jgi:hypothetical protein